MSTYIYKERDREREWDEPRSSTVSIKRYVIPSEDERERDFFYRRDDPGDREVVIRRSVDRDDPVMVQRYEREVDYDSRPYDYRSERDYYEPRGPVYVNPRESDYAIVRRSEVDREPGGYYYHRRVREYDDDRRSRRELSPSDSISQAARHRDDQEAYSSDDSMVYIRKEVREYDDHPHHRRHLAEGALAGVGAAELLRNHRKKEGEEVSDGVGRLGRDVGAGALGAVAAEAVSRVRDHYRSKSRHRSHSIDDGRSSHSRHRHHHHRHHHSHSRRSRSRSHSHSRARHLAELGLGAAAIAGAVALARSKSNSNKDRRSRSRHRRASSSRRSLRDTNEETRSQSQRRKHMAEAGLAGAAVAGLVEKARSRSRSRRRESRSHSALRKALPVVAAGLGTAAATGLYEKNKEKKEEEESRRRERRRSRSRSRAPSEVYPDPTRDSPGLIEYGDHPVQGSIPPNYYGRPVSPHGYYSDASDPVASGAAGFGSSRHRARSRTRSRSRGVRYSSDSSESDGGSRRRRRSRHGKHRSRSRDLAEAALAATGVGYAAHKLSQRNERKKADRERERPESDEDARREPYDSSYKNPLPYPATPAAAPRPIDDHQYYPNSNYFPPPPAAVPRPDQAPYSPADYPPPPGAVPPQSYDYPSGPGPDPYAPRPRRADENVSASNYPQPTVQNRAFDGIDVQSPLRNPRARRRRSRAASQPPGPKSVVFDIHSEHEKQNDLGYETDDSDSTIESIHRSRRNRPQARRHSSSEPYSSYKRSDARSGSQGQRNNRTESDSDSTIDLPDRFDAHGRLLPQPDDDPLAGRLEQLLRGFNRVFA